MIYAIFMIFTLIVVIIAFYQWQYFMIFTPTYYREDILDGHFEMVSIVMSDGVALEGVVFTPEHFASTLLFFAGRSEDSIGLIKKLSLTFTNTRIITFNYRSYGKNKGSINEKNMLEDSLKIAQIVQKNYGDFYLLGFSIGSSVASFVASQQSVIALFLIGAFDSMVGLVKQKYGVNLSWILRYKFDTATFLSKVEAPTYIFVSKSDGITYIQNARALQKHGKSIVLFEELNNLHHKEILWDARVTNKINEVLY